MGNLLGPCFRGSAETSDLVTPDAETRRRQMAGELNSKSSVIN